MSYRYLNLTFCLQSVLYFMAITIQVDIFLVIKLFVAPILGKLTYFLNFARGGRLPAPTLTPTLGLSKMTLSNVS